MRYFNSRTIEGEKNTKMTKFKNKTTIDRIKNTQRKDCRHSHSQS